MSEKTTQQETADRQAPANELLEALGTTISPDLLVQALTHRSFSHEHPGVSNYERLEFLGDAVLELVRSEERRVGKECSEPCRSRWSPYH